LRFVGRRKRQDRFGKEAVSASYFHFPGADAAGQGPPVPERTEPLEGNPEQDALATRSSLGLFIYKFQHQ
jgi:hypothetical protein